MANLLTKLGLSIGQPRTAGTEKTESPSTPKASANLRSPHVLRNRLFGGLLDASTGSRGQRSAPRFTQSGSVADNPMQLQRAMSPVPSLARQVSAKLYTMPQAEAARYVLPLKQAMQAPTAREQFSSLGKLNSQLNTVLRRQNQGHPPVPVVTRRGSTPKSQLDVSRTLVFGIPKLPQHMASHCQQSFDKIMTIKDPARRSMELAALAKKVDDQFTAKSGSDTLVMGNYAGVVVEMPKKIEEALTRLRMDILKLPSGLSNSYGELLRDIMASGDPVKRNALITQMGADVRARLPRAG